MTYGIIPRASIGLDPIVKSSNGTPRPKLSRCSYVTAHYTGVDVLYLSLNAPQAIRNIEFNWAAPQKKPNEYNYVIAQQNDLNVYEYAGEYMAAHSEGENDEAVGILFLNGIKEPPTDLQIAKWHWLIERLISRNILILNVARLRHSEMPNAVTPCPGPLFDARWNEFVQTPIPAPIPTPIPIHTEVDSMLPMIGKYPNHGIWVFSLDGGYTHRRVRPGTANALVAGGAIYAKSAVVVTSWSLVQDFASMAEVGRLLGRLVE